MAESINPKIANDAGRKKGSMATMRIIQNPLKLNGFAPNAIVLRGAPTEVGLYG
jgi:hypothetical protein